MEPNLSQTLTRADIIERIHQEVGLTREDAGRMLESTLSSIVDELAADDGGLVKIVRFGNFSVRSKRERTGRNPRTGRDAPITARRVVSFRPSALLRQRVEAAKVEG